MTLERTPPMKTFYLPPATRSSLLALVGKTANHIAANEWEAVIRFDDVTARCSLRDEAAASQNEHDEVIVTSIDVRPCEHPVSAEVPDELPGRRLTAILVAETIVYFTDHVTYGGTYRFLRGAQSLWSRARAALVPSERQRLRAVVDRMMLRAVGGHNEITTSPSSAEWRRADQRFVNHVETGVLFQFGEMCLPAFTADNRFAMVCSDEQPLWPVDVVKGKYQNACRFTKLTMTPPTLESMRDG